MIFLLREDDEYKIEDKTGQGRTDRRSGGGGVGVDFFECPGEYAAVPGHRVGSPGRVLFLLGAVPRGACVAVCMNRISFQSQLHGVCERRCTMAKKEPTRGPLWPESTVVAILRERTRWYMRADKSMDATIRS